MGNPIRKSRNRGREEKTDNALMVPLVEIPDVKAGTQTDVKHHRKFRI
jgi:hypothetical protein